LDIEVYLLKKMEIDLIKQCIGWLAGCLKVCYYIYPSAPFIQVIKGKLNYENTPGLYATICYINCIIWFIYGEFIFDNKIKYSNFISSCISCVLIIIYIIYELKRYLTDSILNALLLITGTWAGYRALTVLIEDYKFIGKLGIITSILEYITPIQLVYSAITEKYYILIQIYAAWVNFFACGFWIIYGIFLSDFYIIFPNLIGIVISLIQIFVHAKYKKKYPVIGTNNLISNESTLNNFKTSELNKDSKNENIPEIQVNNTTIVDDSKKDIKIENEVETQVKIFNNSENENENEKNNANNK
jgi:solute carrier family 50 protein (sugar transporter)